jgi:hypothetical protein
MVNNEETNYISKKRYMQVKTKIKIGKIPIRGRSTNNHNNDKQNKVTKCNIHNFIYTKNMLIDTLSSETSFFAMKKSF